MTPKLKTRHYWAHRHHVADGRMVLCDHKRAFPETYVRVALLPLEDSAKLVKRVADRLAQKYSKKDPDSFEILAVEALIAAGVLKR